MALTTNDAETLYLQHTLNKEANVQVLMVSHHHMIEKK